jgi:hypothetical protein
VLIGGASQRRAHLRDLTPAPMIGGASSKGVALSGVSGAKLALMAAPRSRSRCAMARSGFPRLGHLCRLVWVQVKRPNAFAVSYLVMNHTVSSIPIK